MDFLDSLKALYKKGGIVIKPENKGKFTKYCGKKVSEKCIRDGKKSKNPLTRKRATFAENAKKWKHGTGGTIKKLWEQ